MNASQAVEAAIRRVVPAPAPEDLPSLRTAMRLRIKPALERLSVKVAESPDRAARQMLRRAFGTTVTLTSGVGSLAALLADSRPLLLSAVRTADIRDSAGVRLQMLADRASLPADGPAAFAFGANEGSTLYTVNAADGAATVTGNFVETDVSLLPSGLVAMLLDEMVGAPAEAET